MLLVCGFQSINLFDYEKSVDCFKTVHYNTSCSVAFSPLWISPSKTPRIGGGVLTGLKKVLRDFTTIGLDCKSGLQVRQLHSVKLGAELWIIYQTDQKVFF